MKVKNMNIYIVKGETGEYDRYQEWDVCAYCTEEAAKNRVTRLTEIASRYKITPSQSRSTYLSSEEINRIKREDNGDPNLPEYIEYTGVEYSYYPLCLINK